MSLRPFPNVLVAGADLRLADLKCFRTTSAWHLLSLAQIFPASAHQPAHPPTRKRAIHAHFKRCTTGIRTSQRLDIPVTNICALPAHITAYKETPCRKIFYDGSAKPQMVLHSRFRLLYYGVAAHQKFLMLTHLSMSATDRAICWYNKWLSVHVIPTSTFTGHDPTLIATICHYRFDQHRYYFTFQEHCQGILYVLKGIPLFFDCVAILFF